MMLTSCSLVMPGFASHHFTSHESPAPVEAPELLPPEHPEIIPAKRMPNDFPFMIWFLATNELGLHINSYEINRGCWTGSDEFELCDTTFPEVVGQGRLQ